MLTSVIGFPRIGADRELKFALEKYFLLYLMIYLFENFCLKKGNLAILIQWGLFGYCWNYE